MKNMYLRSIIILAFIIVSGFGYAQNTIPPATASNNTTADQHAIAKAAPHTFEFIKTKMEEGFTDERMQEILIQIEQKRHPSDTVYFQLSNFTSIKIYPKE